MPNPERPRLAISLGGSVMINKNLSVNMKYLLGFGNILCHRVYETSQQTIIVTGGGRISSMYMDGLKKWEINDPVKLDRMGIGPTHDNAVFLATGLSSCGLRTEYAPTLDYQPEAGYDVLTTGGTKPGQNTDGVLVDWARILGYQQLVNITNTSYIYEMRDGKPNKSKPILDMTWDDWLSITGRAHHPKEKFPFGVVASLKGKEYGMSTAVIGKSLSNFRAYLVGKPYKGTLIHP